MRPSIAFSRRQTEKAMKCSKTFDKLQFHHAIKLAINRDARRHLHRFPQSSVPTVKRPLRAVLKRQVHTLSRWVRNCHLAPKEAHGNVAELNHLQVERHNPRRSSAVPQNKPMRDRPCRQRADVDTGGACVVSGGVDGGPMKSFPKAFLWRQTMWN
jgi:hypothetical protein